MIDVEQICRVLAELRDDAIVVASQTARGPWFAASRRPELDVLYRGVMGKASSLALGLALALPERRVIVLDGDGSLLMNLGTLATIVDSAPANLYHFVLVNGMYAGTGHQRVPAAGVLSFAGIARAAGFPAAQTWSTIEQLHAGITELFATPGPAFVELHTAPVPGGEIVGDNLPRMFPTLQRLMNHLRGATA